MTSKTSTEHALMDKRKAATKPEKPKKFKVVLLNDDFTPFDFVIDVLMDTFSKSLEEAEMLAVNIHEDGKGVCGVYVKDIAELKQRKVTQRARSEGHPLQCVLEPETPAPTNKGMKM